MKVETLGEGEPEIAVVAGIHGDEPEGRNAVEKFKAKGYEIRKPVKFVLANEEAAEKNVRYLDTDLNRSFLGDLDSENHEERLAARLFKELKGVKVLDIHSTHSRPVPFITFSDLNETTLDLIEATGVENAVLFPEDAGTLNENVDGIIIEVGEQGSPEASEMAYEILVNFLAANGVIDEEHTRSEPEVYEHYGTEEGSGYSFVGTNFELVRKGEVFAEKNGEKRIAEEDFYPVLMSTEGYEDIIGFKARKKEF